MKISTKKITLLLVLTLVAQLAFAGTPDEDSIVNNIQMEFMNSPPLTESLLRVGKEWGMCKEYSALKGNFTIQERSAEDFGHKFIRSPHFPRNNDMFDFVSVRSNGSYDLANEELFQKWWSDASKLDYTIAFRVSLLGHLIREDAAVSGWGDVIHFQGGIASALAKGHVASKGSDGFRSRLIQYTVCQPLN